MKIKLAEALLRRKELALKVEQLAVLKQSDVIYRISPKRISVNEGLDEISGEYPKLDASQVTAEYDHYARALRMVDAAIHQANWTHEMDVDDKSMMSWLEAKG